MAYEEFVIPAIQRKDVKDFSSRFRTFSSKEDRDRTYNFLTNTQDQRLTENFCPVTLKVIVQTDQVVQQKFDLEIE